MEKINRKKFLEEAGAIEDEEDDVEYLLKALEIIFKYAYSEETTKTIMKNLRGMMFKRKLVKILEEDKKMWRIYKEIKFRKVILGISKYIFLNKVWHMFDKPTQKKCEELKKSVTCKWKCPKI